MKHNHVVEVPAHSRNEVYSTTCDFCGAELPEDGWGRVNRVFFLHRTGQVWPDGSDVKESGVDMCGSCWDTKVVPWMKSQGVEPRDEEFSY